MNIRQDDEDDWRGLGSKRNAPRYYQIAKILKEFDADKDVLDVGCGEGLLRNYLPEYCNYMGIEKSLIAVGIAKKRNNDRNIVHAKAEDFTDYSRHFSSIVFNEVLYYTADPVGLIRKYSVILKEKGVILCSIFQKEGGTTVKRKLKNLIDKRRPCSNKHCTNMILDFMKCQAWSILHDCHLKIPGTKQGWYIWLAKPK